jgi:hypothetical protein
MFRSQAPYYEEVVGLLNDKGTQIITSREAAEERPNFMVRDLAAARTACADQFPSSDAAIPRCTQTTTAL